MDRGPFCSELKSTLALTNTNECIDVLCVALFGKEYYAGSMHCRLQLGATANLVQR